MLRRSLSLWAKDCSVMLAFRGDAMRCPRGAQPERIEGLDAAVAVIDIDMKSASKAIDAYVLESAPSVADLSPGADRRGVEWRGGVERG